MQPNDEKQNNARPSRSLWLWVTAAFIVLILAWTLLICLAQSNKPEVIPVNTSEH